MWEKVKQTITRHNLISRGEKVIVAVSGGPDSAALMLALLELNNPLVVAHVNYQSRGADSTADENFVRHLAKKLGLKCVVKKVKLDLRQAGFEAEARRIRYQFFEEVAASGESRYPR